MMMMSRRRRESVTAGVALATALLCLGPGSTAGAEGLPTASGTYSTRLTTSVGFELRFTLLVPEGYDPRRPAPLVLSLHHGFDRSRPYPEFFGRGMLRSLVAPGLEKLRAVMVAPDSHGKSWTDGAIEAAVVELVTGIRQAYAIDPERVAVVGFSMGGRGAWTYASRHPDLFTAVVPIASRTDSRTAEGVTAPVFAIHSLDDERVPIEPVQDAVRQLRELGRTAELLTVAGFRHYETPRYQEPLSRAVHWLNDVWEGDRPESSP